MIDWLTDLILQAAAWLSGLFFSKDAPEFFGDRRHDGDPACRAVRFLPAVLLLAALQAQSARRLKRREQQTGILPVG